MAITIEMPRLSDSMHEGIVLRWVKKIGDFVEVGDHLADIETDKAHVELQACEDGTLMEILVPEGGSAAVGAPIALLQSEFGAASCDCPPCPPVKCSPLAARLAAEAGLNAGFQRHAARQIEIGENGNVQVIRAQFDLSLIHISEPTRP